jgi:hypothetical protein
MKTAIVIALGVILSGCVHVYDGFEWRKAFDVRKVMVTKLDQCSCPAGQVACFELFYPVNGSDVWTCNVCNPTKTAAADGHEAGSHCLGWMHP